MNARSWVAAANHPEADFPLANLPYGAIAAAGGQHLAVAIGDQALDLHDAAAGLLGKLGDDLQAACRAPILNPLMALGRQPHSTLRAALTALLTAGAAERERVAPLLRPLHDCELGLAVAIGDYTDFYASVDHAANVGRLFRPSNPLLPNYKYVPIGYHGRASSIGISPAEVTRPNGQRPPASDGGAPEFGPTRQLDYELEVGAFIGPGNALGEPVPIAQAEGHIFGVCLLNDWSARDVQRWEYQPLGPFLGKSFATTLSPWVVPWEALAPFRVAAATRPAGDPEPLAYLHYAAGSRPAGVDAVVEVWLSTNQMREQGAAPMRLSRGNLRNLYWTLGQLVTHHTSNGCNLRPGDLLGTGTISGPDKSQRGCLLELAAGEAGPGSEPVILPTGETRTFLEDGDEVILRAYCQSSGFRVGWGACRGRIVPARQM